MGERINVGIIGATGMVGQRFISLLDGHSYFNISVLAASPKSAGKKYAEVIDGRWKMPTPIPEKLKDMTVFDASDIEKVAGLCDFVFCAIEMPHAANPKEEIKKLEEAYAKAETPVVSNNSACRVVSDVPMLIPEINAAHAQVIEAQRKRLGTTRGFITVVSNCAILSYVPMLAPLLKFGISEVAVSTYQAISGASKTFDEMPEMIDNIIPYIGGEEEKFQEESLKIWGAVKDGVIVNAKSPAITAQCIRVPVTDGHLAAVFLKFKSGKPSKDEIIKLWREFKGEPQQLGLPSAPKQFIHYFEEDNRPQTKSDRDLENGMAVSAGRLREDDANIFDYKFIGLSHNTLRGAAGGGVLSAELLYRLGYITEK